MRHFAARSMLFLLLYGVLSARAQEAEPEPDAGTTLLDPSSITLTDHFEMRSHSLTRDLALRHIEDQIEQKRAEDAARSPLEPFWTASFWQSPLWLLLPIRFGHSRSSDDDPFFTPAYLTVHSRQADYELKRTEKTALKMFEP